MIDTAKRETLTLLGTAAAGAMMTGAAGAQNAAGGSGWCVLTYNIYTNELRNQWAWDQRQRSTSMLS